MYGGPILYVAAQGWYLWAVPHISPRLHLIGNAMLVLGGLAALTAPSYVALILVGMNLTILAILDRPKNHDQPSPQI